MAGFHVVSSAITANRPPASLTSASGPSAIGLKGSAKRSGRRIKRQVTVTDQLVNVEACGLLFTTGRYYMWWLFRALSYCRSLLTMAV